MAELRPSDAAEGVLASLAVSIFAFASDAPRARTAISPEARDMLSLQAARAVAQHVQIADKLARNRVIDGQLAMRQGSVKGLSVGKRRSREAYNQYHREDMRRRAAAGAGPRPATPASPP